MKQQDIRLALGRFKPAAWPLAAFSALVIATLLGPQLWRVDPNIMDFTAFLKGPNFAHPMGTDATGRDVLARFLAGGQLSLLVGAIVVVAGVMPGTLIGLVAARTGGIVDTILMRIMDSVAAFPPILLAMAVAIGLGGGLWTAVLGVVISTLPFFSRLMRGEVLRIQSYPFVEAAKAMGAAENFVFRWHVIPHAASTILVQCASVFGYAIITLAGLGFVGLGAKIPTAEWGLMITEGMKYALTGQWWLTVFPGLGILLAVIIANTLADRLSLALSGQEAS